MALRLRELFGRLAMNVYAKVSGSKGLQLHVPLGGEVGYGVTKPASRRIAEALEGETPHSVVSRMARSERAGRVLIDWSQNTEHKSMICAYSVRARQRPTVSTPVRWPEIEAALDAGNPDQLRFEMDAVLGRVRQFGDPFAPVLSERQRFQMPEAGPRPPFSS